MVNHRWKFAVAAVCMAAAASASQAGAQSTTTGAVTGVVTGSDGRPLENVQVEVVNRSSGFRSGQLTRAAGRYFVQNLEVGSNYAVTVRLIGYAPQTRENVVVTLSQATRADFQLSTQAAQLTAVTVTANPTADALFSPTRQGAQTVVSDSQLRRLPNLDRDFTSFVRLTPQVTNQTGGFSAAGSNPRLSQITIDGANQSDRFAPQQLGRRPGRRGGRPHRPARRREGGPGQPDPDRRAPRQLRRRARERGDEERHERPSPVARRTPSATRALRVTRRT